MSQVNSSLRTLILTLNLLNTDLGLTAEQLLERVPGYLPADRDSAMRKLERDISSLRSTGLNVEVDQEFLAREERPRYKIPRRQSDSATVRLSKEEFAVLTKATNAWEDSTSSRALVILNKLRGKSDLPPEPSATATHLGLDGGPYLPILHQAIANQQPVSFDYQSRSGKEVREVAPWNMVARGKALYLWGFDLNRWAPRLFRLSRFRSHPKLIAEPGAVVPAGVLANEKFSEQSFVVAPVLAVKVGGAPLVRLRCEDRSEHQDQDQDQAENGVSSDIGPDAEGKDVPDGWEVLRGVEDDVAAWEAAIMREADQVVVLEPRALSTSIYSRLTVAADWGSGDHG